MKLQKNKIKGFTLVELIVVIAVLGILSVIVILSFSGIQIDARNAQRSSKMTAISDVLEKYYTANGNYPSCIDMTKDSTTVVAQTLKGLDPDILTAPGAEKGTNSIVCVEPTTNTIGYISDGTQYTLKYKEEGSGNTISFDGRYHRISSTYSLTVIASSGGVVNTSVNGTYASGTQKTITATPNSGYSFSSWTGSAGCSGVASHTITMDADKTCTANFTLNPPVVPSPPASASAAESGFSWSTVLCTNSTPGYRWSVYAEGERIYESGWVGTVSNYADNPIDLQSEYTADFEVQANCNNASGSSAWSASTTDSFIRR